MPADLRAEARALVARAGCGAVAASVPGAAPTMSASVSAPAPASTHERDAALLAAALAATPPEARHTMLASLAALYGGSDFVRSQRGGRFPQALELARTSTLPEVRVLAHAHARAPG